jgi:hypothetical protein
MCKGYVTFINKNEKYLKLLDILVESVLLFSNKKIFEKIKNNELNNK